MATVPSPQQLPNPYTSLAWLSPAAANQYEGSRYLYVASLSVFIWDWMIAWPDEYKIISKAPICPSSIIYSTSRISVFSFLLTSVIFQAAPVGSCEILLDVMTWSLTISVPSTSALFYLRICAVFHNSRIVAVIFGVLWLFILGTAFLIPFSLTGMHIGTTDWCIDSGVKFFGSLVVISSVTSDTLSFFAISYRLASSSMQGSSLRDRFRAFVRGDGLPRISKLLLQGGQWYYFVSVAMGVVTMSMILSPHTSPVFRAMFPIPNIALKNAMATRIFRQVHLGIIQTDMSSSHCSGQLRMRGFSSHDLRSAVSAGRSLEHDVYQLETRGVDHRVPLADHIDIEITKTIETRRDVPDDIPAKADVELALGGM
ncbi:hypothetical protein SCP_1100970 [Sparassis crispa]|uniref:DUF6533 domain-containing protein n=1 Tax=Sparassis crispa TaxID=139825 RepID=A0A401GZ32_9APHY|nr:hypothetical protein SCP_1100970 [Sparassis crispa]GBE87421.1 hypothetical protein SCP_1100970 [Sparassis crispa]